MNRRDRKVPENVRIVTKCRKGDRIYRGADKYLARPGRKQATATDDFDFPISYL